MKRNDAKRRPKDPTAAAIEEFAFVVIGSAVAALSFNVFMRPVGLVSGGIVGVSVILRRLIDIEPAYTQWALNLPLLVLAVAALGPRFGLKSALGSFLLPFFILLSRGAPAATDDPLLAALFAGAGVGAGIGLVFRGKGSVGGLSIIARVIADRTGVSSGTILMALDGTVIVAAGALFGLEAAMYALIVVFVMGRVLDLVRVGLGTSKLALVVSDKHEDISAAVLGKLDRGLTKLFGRGGFSGIERPVLLVVMDPSEIVLFKAAVQRIDPAAFVVFLDAHEVLGLGFQSRT